MNLREHVSGLLQRIKPGSRGPVTIGDLVGEIRKRARCGVDLASLVIIPEIRGVDYEIGPCAGFPTRLRYEVEYKAGFGDETRLAVKDLFREESLASTSTSLYGALTTIRLTVDPERAAAAGRGKLLEYAEAKAAYLQQLGYEPKIQDLNIEL